MAAARAPEAAPLPLDHPAPTIVGGSETVLVAEDEDSSRQAIVSLLEELGYVVLEARDGQAALNIARATAGRCTCCCPTW